MEVRKRRPVRRLRHRLALETYRGEVTASFTACVAGKQDLFVSSDIVGIFRQALWRASDRYQCEVLIYCFMPDHLHVALHGRTPSSDLWKAMTLFKQVTGHWLARHLPRVQWQKDFFDHILREEDELVRQLRYIADNPVRRGLVTEWHAYPFTGSEVLDLWERSHGSGDSQGPGPPWAR
jgi:REP element-mobilizing transposase RayT